MSDNDDAESRNRVERYVALSALIPDDVLRLIPPDVQQTIATRLAAPSEPVILGFPFPVPTELGHTPLVQHAGVDYVCTGCGTRVPDNLRIYEIIEDNQVVGLRMTAGASDDGPLVHACGRGSE
jgi:hypothetical protein